jgi:Zn finger protein HypA/HybF involved in hydrogenase expression
MSNAAMKCDECSASTEASDLTNGQCPECRFIDCDGEREEFVSWGCFCGQHKVVR